MTHEAHLTNSIPLPFVRVEDATPTTYQNRDAWLVGRKENAIGASEVAAALGLSPYCSAYTLWAQKVGLLQSDAENRAMRRGVVMEPFIASEYECESRHRLIDYGRWTVFRSVRYSHLSCTPDRIIAPFDERGPGLWEAKSVTNRDAWTKGSVPEHYRIQVMAGMAVLGLQWSVLSGYVAGTDEIISVEIQRDEFLIDALAEATAEFWAMVLDGRRSLARCEEPTRHPDIDESEATALVLKRQYRQEIAQNAVPELGDAAAADLERDWEEADAALDAAQKRIGLVKNRAMALLGARPEVRLPGGTKITWKTKTMPEHVRPANTFRELRRYAPKRRSI